MDRETFNEIAWRDFIMFAWGQEEAHAAFRGATGRPQRRRTGSPIDALIDRACGTQDDQYMQEFVDWVTENHWGENYAPEKWKKLRVPAPSAHADRVSASSQQSSKQKQSTEREAPQLATLLREFPGAKISEVR